MADWTASMEQTFEYYKVDPATWKDSERIENVVSCSITRDMTVETKGSASFNVVGPIDECYIRIYLVTIQNGVKERHPLGTYMVQTPSIKFDGKVSTVTLDAYTPLIELREKDTELGYYIQKNANIMDYAYEITRANLRAPVVKMDFDSELEDNFVSEANETYLSYITALMSNANFAYDIDPLGYIIFKPIQSISAMQPIWTFNDDNSSILYPEITMSRDLYGIPNVVEVIYSRDHETTYSKVVNDNPNSPVSTVRRGREITLRIVNPSLVSGVTKEYLDAYARDVLRQKSSIEYTVTYKHAYCPVRSGDCVLLNYERAGIKNAKAYVISQTIVCEAGTPVSETAIFTQNLWEAS